MEPVLLLRWRPDRQSRTLLKRSQSDQDRSLSVEEDLRIYPSNLMLKVRTVRLCRSTDTDNISEVADMEVDAHQVTGPAVADYTINKPQSGRAASRKLQRQGAVIDLDSLLKRAGHALGSNGYIKFYQQAVGKVIKKMSPKQMEQAAGTAKEWNNSHPPAEIQAK